MLLFVNPQIEFRVPTGFGAKTETKTPKHPSIKDFIFYVSHFLPIEPKPKLDHYEHQTEEQALAEDEAAYELEEQSMMEIPNALVPKVRNLIVQYQSQKQL